jgi:class 3 adenylate cyclase
MTEYALKLFEVVQLFNQRHQTNLALSIGIDAGEVMAGIVGKHKFVYDIWGEAVNDANRISHEAVANTLRVSKIVYTQLTDQERYTQCANSSEETYCIEHNIKED